MTAITPTTTTTTQPAASSSASGSPMLGKDDFLKLLVSQLQHQDPMNPVDDKDFMGQVAQFTSVEQLTNMSKAIDSMSTASQTAQSVSLLGKTVAWKKADETTGEGVASAVSFADGSIAITVGDTQIAPGDIQSVR
jgi:flagellar basal-body rod modification protein FlgD